MPANTQNTPAAAKPRRRVTKPPAPKVHDHGGASEAQLATIGTLASMANLTNGKMFEFGQRYGELVGKSELTPAKADEIIRWLAKHV